MGCHMYINYSCSHAESLSITHCTTPMLDQRVCSCSSIDDLTFLSLPYPATLAHKGSLRLITSVPTFSL